MRLIFKQEPQVYIKAGNAWEQIIAKAATAAVKETGQNAVAAVQRNIAGAGFGPRWQKSIRLVMKPKSGDVLNPFGWVHSTINFADVFETGKHIEGHDWLWLPTDAVPPWPGDPTRQMSPKKFTQDVGPLFSIRRPGRPPALAAVGFFSRRTPVTAQKITKRTFSQLSSAGKIGVAVIMFVGIKDVMIEKRFAATAAIEKEAARLPEIYAAKVAPLEGPL